MSDSDGNVFVSEGATPAPAAPPPSSSGSDVHHAIRDVPNVVDALTEDFTARNGDDPDTRPAWKREPDEPIVDLDKPGYDRADPRSRLSKDDATVAPTDKPAPPEIKPPRSWSKEEQKVFSALDPETQARIAAREQSREAYFSEKQSEIDRARHQTESELQQRYGSELEQAAALRRAAEETYRQTSQEVSLQHQLSQAVDVFRSKYGDISSEQLLEIHNRDPALAQQIHAEAQQVEAAAAQLKELSERRTFRAEKEAAARQQEAQRQQLEQHQVQQKQFADWRQQQDQLVSQHVEELRDPVKAVEIQRAALKTLESYGFTQQELAAQPLAYDARVQRLIASAAKWEIAQEKARNSRPVAAPRPQRPGLSNGTGGSASELAGMADRGDMSAYFKARRSGKVR